MTSLKRITSLVKKTGEKVIIFHDDNPFVVMGLKDYEKIASGCLDLSDLSEEEMMKKINRDIAVWKAGQDKENEQAVIEDLQEKIEEQLYHLEPLDDGNISHLEF